MEDLLAKISSYNFFNFLFPGVIFAVIAERVTSYTFLHNNLVIDFFVCYFIGLTISRVGSLLLEPLLLVR